MHQIAAQKGLERHVLPPNSDVFPRTWRTHQRRKISVSRPYLEGNVCQMAHLVADSGYNKGQLRNLVEAILPKAAFCAITSPYSPIRQPYRARRLGY